MEAHLSRRKLVIGLGLVIILDTAGQLLWKFAVENLPATAALWEMVEAVLHEPWFLVVAAIFLCQLANWLKVLERADLSFALPITSLSYITVLGLSCLLFDEPVGLVKGVGVACVLTGVWLIGQGDPQRSLNQDARS